MSKSSYTLNSVRETKEKSLDALLAVVLPGGICLLSYRCCLLSKLHRSRVPPSQQPFLGWKYNYHPFLITYLARVICCCCNLLAGLQSAVQLQLPSSARLWQIWRVDSPCRLPWHPLNTGALVHPFAKTCKLQVMLTLGSLHSLLSRGTQLGCWNSYVPGKKDIEGWLHGLLWAGGAIAFHSLDTCRKGHAAELFAHSLPLPPSNYSLVCQAKWRAGRVKYTWC